MSDIAAAVQKIGDEAKRVDGKLPAIGKGTVLIRLRLANRGECQPRLTIVKLGA